MKELVGILKNYKGYLPGDWTNVTTYLTLLSTLTRRCRPVTHKLTTVKESNFFHTSARNIHQDQDRMDRITNCSKKMDDSLLFSGTFGRATFSCRKSPAVIQSIMWFLSTGPTARFSIHSSFVIFLPLDSVQYPC